MKKISKKILAILITVIITTLTFPTEMFVFAEDNAQVIEFNLFRDAGETDELFANAIEIIQNNWDDDYFSSIIMTLGEAKLYVDGEKITTSHPAVIDDDGEIMLPVMDLAEALGVDAEIDQKTGDITIEENGNKINLEFLSDNASSGLASSDVKDVVVSEDNTVTKYMGDGSILTKLPAASESQVENELGLDVHRDGDKIIITNPYQLKEILLYVKDGGILKDDYQADEVITNDQGLYFLQYLSEELTKDAFEAFASDPGIEKVILNRVARATAIPGGSWGTNGNTNSMGIQADRMKNHLGNSGSPITVAVADTGVDVTHPHLQGRTVPGWGYNNITTDGDGHGTHVAGTVVDCTPDNVKIMPIKVLDDSGRLGSDIAISQGITKAVEYGAKVINMSLGWEDGTTISLTTPEQNISQAITQAIEYAATKNVAVVVAAGNSNMDTRTYYPAKLGNTHGNVITVAAVDQNDLPAYFSNYGDAVDVAAPGVDIKSSIPGEGYANYDGTSMAAPHVSASVAMLALKYPSYPVNELENELKNTTVDLGTPGWDRVFGRGRVDFRMFNGSGLGAVTPVSATSFELKQIIPPGGFLDSAVVESVSSVKLEYGEIAEGANINAIVSPKGATNKSVTYTSSNINIAVYQDGKVFPKKVGSATITASKSGISNKTCAVSVADNWINHAASSYAGGTGSANDPYLIATAPQLAKLAYETRINKERYYNKYFKLTNDIDLSAYPWTPIGAIEYKNLFLNTSLSFQGVFNGNGHSVTNMDVNATKNRYWEYLGLFGFIRGYSETRKAEIKNLAVTNANVIGSNGYTTGVLCGTAFATDISNCFTEGNSSGAGLVGWLSGSTVKNCYSIVDAGMAGLVSDNAYSHISNSYSAGFMDSAGFVYSQRVSPSITNSFSFVVHNTNVNWDSAFMYKKDDGSIKKCYYPDVFTGINPSRDADSTTTSLTPKPTSFFKTKSSYITASNWDSSSPWDFDNVWDIDANYNSGFPYLRIFRKIPVISLSSEPYYDDLITHSWTFSDYSNIRNINKITGKIDYTGEIDMYKFVAPDTGRYTFNISLYTFYELYDSDLNMCYNNYNLIEGKTYYLKVFSNKIQNYEITVNIFTDGMYCIAADPGAYMQSSFGGIYNYKLAIDGLPNLNEKWKITQLEGGFYTISFASDQYSSYLSYDPTALNEKFNLSLEPYTGAITQKWKLIIKDTIVIEPASDHNKHLGSYTSSTRPYPMAVVPYGKYGSEKLALLKTFDKSSDGLIISPADGIYEIQRLSYGKLIHASNWINGASAHLWESAATNLQKMRFERLSDGTYKITVLSGSGGALTNPNSYANGTGLQFSTWTGGDHQKWYVVDCGNGLVKFINKYSGLAIDISENGTGNGTKIQQWQDVGVNAQRFKLIPASLPYTSMNFSDGVYEIQGQTSGKLIHAADWINGSRAHLWESVANNNLQKMRFERQSDGTYKITVLATGGSLTNPNSYLNGTGLQFSGWTGGDHQRWYVVDCGGGLVKLINKHSGLAIDISDNGTANGTKIGQWKEENVNAQRFSLIPV